MGQIRSTGILTATDIATVQKSMPVLTLRIQRAFPTIIFSVIVQIIPMQDSAQICLWMLVPHLLAPAGLNIAIIKKKLNFVSTSVAGISVIGNTFTVTGEGTVNKVAGYTFKATIIDANPDTIEIVIYDPGGSVYFTANPAPISSCSINGLLIKQYQLVTAVDPQEAGSVSPDCSSGTGMIAVL